MATEEDIFAAHLALKHHPKRPHSYRLSGIRGDSRHFAHGGYHVPPDHLRGPGCYSWQKRADRIGAKRFPHEASAWDLTFNARDMKRVTERLLNAAKKRNRAMVITVSEFCGTRDGKNTYPFDVTGNYCEGVNSWDDSHLWHVHISFLRNVTRAQVLAIVNIICGITPPTVKTPTPAKPPAHHPSPRPRPIITPKPSKHGPKATQVKHTPFPLRPGHYFGDIHGPARSHGGFYSSERGSIARIQRKLIRDGAVRGVPRGAWRKSKWVDGRFEGPTIAAVKTWQSKHKLPVTGRVDARTWKAMF